MEPLEQQALDSIDPDCGSYLDQVIQDPLGPARAGPFIIGAICEVNGEGAAEHTTRVTKFELELLCKHWAETLLSADRMWQVYGQTGSREIREGPYAKARLHQLAEILGRENVQAIVAKVYKDYEPEKEREAYEASLAQQADPPRDQPLPEESAEGSLPF